jgi:pimeloyl-ACP methyl ester carboxylesterase
MTTKNVNGVRLFYALQGDGEVPLVMVHGGFTSHHGWRQVAPRLAADLRVVTYDRRGYSESERPGGTIRENVGDLAGLIEGLGLAPTWVAGVSSGGAIALRLAAERPDLLRGLIVHEPALFALLAGDPEVAPILEEARRRLGAVVERIASGDHAGGAKQFIETVAMGPGGWAELPPDDQQILIGNAPTFLSEVKDPEVLAFDLAWIQGFSKPTLLTLGEKSPPLYPPVFERLVEAMPKAEVQRFADAGHTPHRTHPDDYVAAVSDFIRRHGG